MVYIKWIGHASFLIKGSYGNLLIDPFIYENPIAKYKEEDLEDIDLILVTHGHNDHLGDTIEIAEKNNATVVGIYELSKYIEKFGIKTVGMNFGGLYKHKGIDIYLFPAKHSSGYIDDHDNIIYLGEPGGFVIKIDDRTIYHAGDTMVFEDMKIIPKIAGDIDLALLPIGGHFTMDINQALIAIDYIKPKKLIPMHYNTWNIIKADPKELKEKTKDTEIKILNPGDSIEI